MNDKFFAEAKIESDAPFEAPPLRRRHGRPRVLGVVTGVWAFVAASGLVVFAILQSVVLSAVAVSALVLAKAVDHWTRRAVT
ncbi:hypothetical protein [Amycolatopsis alkalitolerans]|uniref:DUF3040 domain-containing protein n=1 Tax=Amycolatopsis alkalitolerans TaxID=2547244 RepID=A0A5C4M7Y5_9PSEU|nr:hypothetical protein [Amycolatopsis alkalitolerans]TNC29495.1 hypothetical protein FG385_00500 [Amycolatopsis alkalitolerans]